MAKTFKFGENGKWATKTGSSLAYNDQNDNFKPMPFSVTRDSIATRVNKEGLIEVVGKDKLRIDYKDSSKGVALLEPARTNLVQYSEDFSQWTNNGGVGVVSSSEISPDGITNAYDLTDGGSNYRFLGSNSVAFNGTYTASIFIKKTTGLLSHYAGLEVCLAGSYLIINTTNGDINQTGSDYSNIKSEDFGDWWRISVTVTNSDTGSILQVWSAISSNGTSISPSANGTNTFFGAMVENGSYPTSYIPTSGAAVPRAADVANGAGNSEVFNDSEGVLMAEISALANDGTNRVLSLSNGSYSNSIRIQYYQTSNQLEFRVVSSGSLVVSQRVTTNNVTLFNKILVKYKLNDFAMWVNGFELITDTSGATPIGLDEIRYDDGDGNVPFYGKTKQIQYFDTALTDAELEALTSYTSFTNMANELNLTIK